MEKKSYNLNVADVEFLNKCEIQVELEKLDGAKLHMLEKFIAYARPRGITIKGLPRPCTVKIFTSPKDKTHHIACPAIHDGVRGWIVNMDSARDSKCHKTLHFYSEKEASCSKENGKYCANVCRKPKLRRSAKNVTTE